MTHVHTYTRTQMLIGVTALLALTVAAPSTARADRLRATFQYVHDDGLAPSSVTRPVAFMKVTVWRGLPFPAQIADVTADSTGSVDVTVANAPLGTQYFLKIFAWNSAAKVMEPAFFPGATSEWEYSTSPVNLPWSRNINWGTISFNSTVGAPLNIADAIRKGRDYAIAHRDPSEVDSANIPQVFVQPYTQNYPLSPTFYQPAVPASLSRLHISFNFWQDDLTLLHEYAHFLQHTISKFAPVPAQHDGCWATTNPWWPGTTPWGAVTTTGPLLNSLGHGWMEGFANYYALAVDRWYSNNPTDIRGPSSGSIRVFLAENPRYNCTAGGTPSCTSCPAVGLQNTSGETITAAMIENTVAAVLWDLVDDCIVDAAATCDQTEPDRVVNKETEIFQIFDREMGQVAGCPAECPSFYHFHDAWVRRGLDDVGLDELNQYVPVDGGGFQANPAAIATQSLKASHVSSALDQTSPAARNPTGGASIMVRGTDDRMWVNDQIGVGGFFSSWYERNGTLIPSNTLVGPPTTVQSGTGFWVAARMLDGSISYTVRTGTATTAWVPNTAPYWYGLGRPDPGASLAPASVPVLARHSSGRIFVFARDSEDRVWVKFQSSVGTEPTRFGEWVILWGTVRSSLAAVATTDGRVHVFGRGTDSAVWRKTCTPPSPTSVECDWGDWFWLGGDARSAPTALLGSTGLAEVYMRGASGGVQRVVENSPGVFGVFAPMDTPPVEVAPNAGVSTPGAGLWTRSGSLIRRKVSPNLPTQVWQTLPALGVGFASTPAVALDSSGVPVAFVEGGDQAGWVSRFSAGVWSPWQSLGGVIKGFSTNVVGGEEQ